MVKNVLKVIHVLEGLPQEEHLTILTVYKLQSKKISDWQQELEADLGILKTTVSEILTQDLGMKHVVAKFVPQLLLPEQKEYRAAVANDLIQTAITEPDFLKKTITRDELWVYVYDLETKAQLSQWKSSGSPRLKKVRQSCNKIMTMLTVFWLGRRCPSWACPSRPNS